MSNHTPGEWKVRGDFHIGIEGDPFSLAEVKSCNTVPADKVEEHKANARLIAAAPDLLAACAGILALYDAALSTGKSVTWKGELVDAMRAAVKKAQEIP